jgi:CO/xanthine dehydrogenase FAD-binding subunit
MIAGARQAVFPLAGGTDLVVQMRSRSIPPDSLIVDLGGLNELRGIQTEAGGLQLGALKTHHQLAASPLLQAEVPLLASACARVGTPQIRNRGTLGGNVVHASPAADSLPPLLVHEAMLLLCSPQAKRRISLERFLLGPYQVARKADELLVAISIPRLAGYRFGYQRLIRRQAVGIARIIVAVALRLVGGSIAEARIACGAVTPTACRLRRTEEWLRGKDPIVEVFHQAGLRASQEGIGYAGLRWSTPYKEPVLRTLVQRALCQAGNS